MGYRMGSRNISLPHSVQTWIMNPSWALMEAQVGSKITFDQLSTHPAYRLVLPMLCGVHNTIVLEPWMCPNPSLNLWPDKLNWNAQCPPPTLLLKHLKIFCGVPTLAWTSDHMSQIGMCVLPPPPLILKHIFISVVSLP